MTGMVASQAARALRYLVRQTVISGTPRRAALLHMDQLPPALARSQYRLLARNILTTLAERDHAVSFELSHDRLAIVWRSRGPEDIERAMAALEHLMADLPQGQAVPVGQLMSVFDLPDQAPWLLDRLVEADHETRHGVDHGPGLDAALLTRLEEALVQADLSPFLRARPVMDVAGPTPVLAWEDRTVSCNDLVGCLCPGRHVQDGSWLFRRLSRSIDRRTLNVLTGPRELDVSRPFSLAISVASILSPAFLAFDAGLAAGLRGRIVLRLEEADILADAASFTFARNFAHARQYRLLLRDAGAGLLDHDAAGLDFLELRLRPDMRAHPERLPARDKLVLAGVDDAALLDWARAQGCALVKGQAVAA
jgi:hypothetical protein